ncbi:MAG TPA: topoisomerase DNA-binding C4 zinc finger domain-containing protein, partial [Allocoleopsis sp.]
KKLSEHKVLEEAKEELTKLLNKFKKHEEAVGKELQVSYKKALESESHIGPCPICKKGSLRVTYSKISKRKFIGCDRYPDCKTIINMPFGGFKKTDKTCEKCHFPILLVFRGKRPQQVCINNECPTKHSQDAATIKELKDIESGKLKKKCPKCGKELIVRTSLYGQFLACPGYPDCRYIESLNKTGKDGKVIQGRGYSNDFKKKGDDKKVSKTKSKSKEESEDVVVEDKKETLRKKVAAKKAKTEIDSKEKSSAKKSKK